MKSTKPIIGLCGGIGAGKSLAAAAFERLGCLVVDSDKLNHEILAQPDVLSTLRSWWGDEVATADGRPNRSVIAGHVFGDAGNRRRLQELTYPLIAARRADMIRVGSENPAIKAIILDSPLLFESNLNRLCNSIVFIEADESQRLQRVSQTRGWDQDELTRRERWQISTAEKRSRSQFVIRNDGSSEQLQARVAVVLEQALEAHGRKETE